MLSLMFNNHLEDGEKIYYIAHRHPVVALKSVLKYGFFGIVLPIIFVLLFPPFWLFAMIWAFLGFMRLGYEFMDWYFDAWVMTNTSVIDLEWRGLFQRSSTRVEYHMIEGLTYEYAGFWQTMLRYGDISVQKIGSGAQVQLKDAMNPRKVESHVLELQNKFVSDKSYREHDALKDLLTDMLQDHAKKY